MNKNIILLLNEIKVLSKCYELLNYSYNVCFNIGVKDKYSNSELDSFESFTARYARLTDILIQKVYRLIDDVEFWEQDQ